jgi:small subunit ribosomal protein S17
MSDIGVGARGPKKSCDDRNCPFHGQLSVRRKFLDGKVVSAKMTKTVTVERDYLKYTSKYTRYEKRRSRIMAHSPPCLESEKETEFDLRNADQSVRKLHSSLLRNWLAPNVLADIILT